MPNSMKKDREADKDQLKGVKYDIIGCQRRRRVYR